MSVNDANPLGGDKNELAKNSPNIKSSVDTEPEVDKLSEEEARRKAKETVAIDGIPIDEKDIKFHSKNIKEADTGKLFVKIEGAEERKKAAIREMEKKQNALRREAKEQQRSAERAEKKVEHTQKRRTRLQKLYDTFWRGKRKIATFVAIIAIISAFVFIPMIVQTMIIPIFQKTKVDDESNSSIQSSMSATEVLNKAQEIMEEGEHSSEAYDKARDLFKTEIDKAEGQDKMYLTLEYGNFIFEVEGNADNAAEVILEFKPEGMTDYAMADYYAMLSGIYDRAGDPEKADFYNQEMIKYLPEDGPTGLVDYGDGEE
jgi:tetratricopeptide (TPR) repeat protein